MHHKHLIMPVLHRTPLLPNTTLKLLLFRRHLSTSPPSRKDSSFRRTDFSSQPFSQPIDASPPVTGPLSHSSKLGPPRLTPSLLKAHLDKFVVGQDRAKKVTSVVIYNHYQRIRELRRQAAEAAEREAKRARGYLRERERNAHPVESMVIWRSGDVTSIYSQHLDEFPGHVETVDLNYRPILDPEPEPDLGSSSLQVSDEVVIEKSNVMLLGPSGVGKTYILSTLARVLEVPFATVDCSSLTQAGYIGTDIESSIERLLLASNHDIAKCESGIIFFDEVDKLAKPAVITHGRDGKPSSL